MKSMEADDVIPLETEEANKSNQSDDKVSGVMPNGENNDVEQVVNDDLEIEEGQLMSEEAEDITPNDIDGSSVLDHQRVDCAETGETLALEDVGVCSGINDADVEEGQLVAEREIGGNDDVGRNDLSGNVARPSENGSRDGHGTLSDDKASKEGGSTSGAKRPRARSEDEHPSIHVKYFGLSRKSKRKLDQLLQEWSQWCARNGSRLQDEEVPESGEEIYFPALDVGMGKTSTVSFWVENEVKKPQDKDFVPMEDDLVPLYDRGFALGLISAEGSNNLEGGLDVVDAPRCFNCGSYSHSLKECPKPRDNAAVNNSRKQLKSRRNQTAGMRNLTRYYQDSPGGKYEGLRPGVLAPETRRLLGLGEFDPPPWLNRMREIGYPPGYLVPDEENLPSGICIFADEDVKDEKEEGEILEVESVDPPRKMTVNIPGINAPIPESADEKLWAARSSNTERHRNGDSGRSNHYSESSNRGRYNRDDDQHSFDRASRYPNRSPSFLRSPGDRERNDPLDSEDSLAYRLYSSYSYDSSRRYSEHSNSSEANRDDYPDYSSRSRDRHRHRSGR